MSPSPERSLRACVVVPAHNEEALISRCLEALAVQKDVSRDEYEVFLVLDRCTDATGDRAGEIAEKHPDFRLRVLDGPGRGAGHARRVGMDAACERLLKAGRPDGLIASTDADTVVAGDWLSAQLEVSRLGARAIGGRIELEQDELSEEVFRWREEQGRLRHREVLSNGGTSGVQEHWQFSGASLALTAEAYREIGGLEPRAALEDEHLETTLIRRGVRIERPLSVRVTTSARLNGRAERGLSRDLALASWFSRNTYYRKAIPGETSPAANTTAILTLGEDAAPECVLDEVARAGFADETILLGRREVFLVSGAGETSTIRAEGLAPEFGPVRGPGDLLWRTLSVVEGDVVAVLDGDAPDLSERLRALSTPLREKEELHMVQGFGMNEEDDSKGLSESLARPWINLHFPRLSGLFDPLSLEFAARRDLLEALPFAVGEGFVLSLLIDASRKLGMEALAQAELPSRSSPKTKPDAAESAYAVLAALEAKLDRSSEESPSEESPPGPLVLPGPGGLEVRRVPLEERPPRVCVKH